MIRILASVLIATLLLPGSLLAGATVDAELQSQLADVLPGQTLKVIVRFNDTPNFNVSTMVNDGPDARETVMRALRANARNAQKDFGTFAAADSGVKNIKNFWIANAISCEATPEAIEQIAARADVKEVIPNEIIQLEPTKDAPQPKDEVLSKEELTYTYGLKRIKIPELRSVYGLDGQGVVVGEIDTGIDFEHPDLQGKMVAWKDFVNNKPEPYDDQGHGTHVAGTIVGGQTSGLAIGVAPGAKIIGAKAFSSSGSAQSDWLLGAMQWMTDPDGDPSTNDAPPIVSNSWGGGPGRTVFLEATQNWVNLGIFPLFAAGNSGPGAGSVGTPGGFLESFAIGATTSEDTIASFSSRGPVTWDGTQHIKPDVSAPGKDVTSAKNGGGYRTISGTSMATPHVAGVIALMLQASPGMGIDQMRELLEGTSDDMGDAGKDNTFGAGRVNALAAAQIAVSGGKIVGELTDAEGGAGLKGTIRVKENGFVIQTGADGGFKFVLPEGTYTLQASSFGFTPSEEVSVSLGAQEEAEVTMALARAASGTLKGKVVSAATGEELSARITILDTPLDPIGTADEGGAFQIELPGGSYKLLITAWGYEPFTSDDVTVAEEAETEVTFSLEKLPAILVVDDDASKDYEKYYKQALEAAEQRFSLINSTGLASNAGEILGQYSMVIWFTGDNYRDTLSASDQAALTEFVSSGGRVFLSGQDIGYELKSKPFYAEFLKAKFVKDAAGNKDVSGAGLTFKIEGGDGANNQRYPDKIEALAGGETYLSYGGEEGPAGLKIDHGNGRVLYLAFGFEGVDTAASRAALLEDALGWLMPSTLERIERISTMPRHLKAAYADLMAREALELDEGEAESLAEALEGAKGSLFGKVRKALLSREVLQD